MPVNRWLLDGGAAWVGLFCAGVNYLASILLFDVLTVPGSDVH